MALSSPLIDHQEQLFCAICLEIIDKPRTLPCQHSFCHICLSEYISKFFVESPVYGFSCPICRAFTRMNTNGKDEQLIETWVETLDASCSSILNRSNDKITEDQNSCQPCLREKQVVKATTFCFNCNEKLCERCKLYHTKFKATMKHNILDISDNLMIIPKLISLNNLTRCIWHEEKIKSICRDHDVLCCTECTMQSHRKCEHIISIASEVQSSENKLNMPDQLGQLEAYANDLYKFETKRQSEIDISRSNTRLQLSNLKIQVMKMIEEYEKSVLECEDMEILTIANNISKQKHLIENLKHDIKNSLDKFNTAHQYGQALHKFIVEHEISNQIKKYELLLLDIQRNASIEAVTFEQMEPMEDVKKILRSSFKFKKHKTWPPPSMPLEKKQVHLSLEDYPKL